MRYRNFVRAILWPAMLAICAPAAGFAAELPVFAAPVAGAMFSHRAPSATTFGYPVDLDGDGRAEIVQPFLNFPPDHPNRPEPILLLRADPLTFAFSVANSSLMANSVPAFVHPRVFAKGDFNGDGRTDLFIGGHGYDTAPFHGEKDALLLSNRQNTKHVTRIPAPNAETFTHATASGDINGDGIDDLYVGTLCCSATGPYILLGRKDADPVVASGRLPGAVAQRTSKYASAALVDMNGGKGKDLVLGTDGGHDSVIYFNNGGSFAKSKPDVVLPPGLFGRTNTIAVDILAADLNTDGYPDLILSQTKLKPFYEGYGLQVLWNSKNTVLTDKTAQTLLQGSGLKGDGHWKIRVFAADFYGDGITDFVVNGGCPNRGVDLVVWINDGAGTFTPYNRKLFDNTDARTDCNLLYPVDVNLDGRSDLVWIVGTGATTDQARTYRNLGVATPGTVKPQIVRPPAAPTVKTGEEILLSVSARGQRPLHFQWLKNGNPIGGATKPVFRIAHAALPDAVNYSVRITNAAGSVTSGAVKAKVQ
jgi:hypothetical protein